MEMKHLGPNQNSNKDDRLTDDLKYDAAFNILTGPQSNIESLKYDLKLTAGPVQQTQELGCCQPFLIRWCNCCLGLRSEPYEVNFDDKVQRRQTIIALAKMRFDNSNEHHWGLIKRIYSQLRYGEDRVSDPDYKYEWDYVGFQNKENPTTDVRGTGMLGLLSILYCIDKKQGQLNIKEIFELSVDKVQNYPFTIACF